MLLKAISSTCLIAEAGERAFFCHSAKCTFHADRVSNGDAFFRSSSVVCGARWVFVIAPIEDIFSGVVFDGSIKHCRVELQRITRGNIGSLDNEDLICHPSRRAENIKSRRLKTHFNSFTSHS